MIHFRGNPEPEEVSVLRTGRIGHAVAAIVCLGFVFGVSVDWIGHAQQPAAPAVAAQPPTGIPIEAAGFVGKTATLETTGYSVSRRIFAPGSHNATWHMHTAGQFIFAESGHGRSAAAGVRPPIWADRHAPGVPSGHGR